MISLQEMNIVFLMVEAPFKAEINATYIYTEEFIISLKDRYGKFLFRNISKNHELSNSKDFERCKSFVEAKFHFYAKTSNRLADVENYFN